jgi:PilZ domain
MQERRKISRKYLAVYSRVFDRGSGRVLGYLADLSRKGTMIISDNPLPERQMINLRFDLPDPPLFSADHLDVQAQVAWSRPDVDPSFYNVGFEFLSVNEQQAGLIDEMIESYEFNRTPPDYPPSPSVL